MINSKQVMNMSKKCQKLGDIKKKKLPLGLTGKEVSCSLSPVAVKGHFIVYTTDKRRFMIPLAYLNNEIFKELLKLSEEEFGLPNDGPIVLPCDAHIMQHIVLLIQKGESIEAMKNFLMPLVKSRCRSSLLPGQGSLLEILVLSCYIN